MNHNRLSKGEYAKLKRQIHARDDGLCVLCARIGTDAHHVIFRSQGGKDTADNLVTLCRHCHQAAHGVGNPAHGQKEIRNELLAYLERIDESE